MKNTFIEKCFESLEQNQSSIFKLNLEKLSKKYHISRDIFADQKVDIQANRWLLMESSLDESKIKSLENKYNIKFPQLYRDFLTSYAHLIYLLEGKLDNFLFEDDVAVVWQPGIQPLHHELDIIDKQIGDIRELLQANYLYIGDFNCSGPLCIDLNADKEENMKIVWLDYEMWCSCNGTRAEYEEIESVIFDNFHQLMECFFLKKVIECKV